MNTNENYLKSLNEIQNMIGNIRTIKEAVSFGDEYDDAQEQIAPEEEMGPQEPDAAVAPEGDEMAAGEQKLAKMPTDKDEEDEALANLGEVDAIRELCLRGMTKRCHNVQDPAYDALKKILQLCDKAIEPKEEGVK